jgi:2-polyprenyl-6-methoxyphenol hydroxylase-like FAD-dependent oxidoreductase
MDPVQRVTGGGGDAHRDPSGPGVTWQIDIMTSTTHASPQGSHAIVIGAGITGLVTARVLLNHFDRVTLLERDRLPEGPEARKGVPQGHHVHLLLTAGSRIVEELFPGIDDDLAAAAVPAVDIGWDALSLFSQGQMPRLRTNLTVRSSSRAMREWTIRRRLLQRPNVRVIEGCEVAGLASDRGAVTGVRVRSRGQEAEAQKAQDDLLSADFVVDAAGRGSRSREWLGELGYPPPTESVVSSFLGYASCIFRLKHPERLPYRMIGDMPAAPDRTRGAFITEIEGGVHIVTLFGAARDYPPTGSEGFIEWTRDARTPLIYEALEGAEPLSPVHSYRRTENRFCHFERMPRWPERFVVLGDAVACFNPVYGQGMTVGAQSAMALDKHLRKHRARRPGRSLTGLAPSFQRRLARRLIGPWLLATGEDFRWPATEGEKPNPAFRLFQRYTEQVLTICMQDEEAYRSFLQVQHGIRPAQSLFHPAIAAKVLRRALHV